MLESQVDNLVGAVAALVERVERLTHAVERLERGPLSHLADMACSLDQIAKAVEKLTTEED